MKTGLLTIVPFLTGGTFSVEDSNPIYILITLILTAFIEYVKWRRAKKKECDNECKKDKE